MNSIEKWISLDEFTEKELRQVYDDLLELPVVQCDKSCLLNPQVKKADRYRECSDRVVPALAVTRRFLARFHVPMHGFEGTPRMKECFHMYYYCRIMAALKRHLKALASERGNR